MAGRAPGRCPIHQEYGSVGRGTWRALQEEGCWYGWHLAWQQREHAGYGYAAVLFEPIHDAGEGFHSSAVSGFSRYVNGHQTRQVYVKVRCVCYLVRRGPRAKLSCSISLAVPTRQRLREGAGRIQPGPVSRSWASWQREGTNGKGEFQGCTVAHGPKPGPTTNSVAQSEPVRTRPDLCDESSCKMG